MFNSKSPFYVRPSLNTSLLSWGLKFVKSASKQHVEKTARPLRDISLFSKALFKELELELDNFGLQENGILMLYKTAKVEEEEIHLAEKAKKLGLDVEVLSADACCKLQPKLDIDIKGAVHYKCDAHLYPYKLMPLLIRYLEESGVKILRNKEVDKIRTSGSKITSVCSGNEEFTADEYILAGGSWSPGIAKLAGLKMPLMPGKGYSFMIEEPQKRMHIPAILCEARVAVTPMNGSIRLGGTMEIDKINNKINMARVKGIVESTSKYFPQLKPAMPAIESVWYGFRPCSPDGIPYIGRVNSYQNLVVATGHGMMGISLGPGTGKLISEILNHQKPSLETDIYSPSRYF